jgi:hypothetical protein
LEHVCVVLQGRPQAPQLPLSVRRFRQTPEQLVCPLGHVALHVPLRHAAEPPVGAVHTRPQAPQWATVLRRSVSHPLAALPSQLPKPVLHAPRVHVPLVQVALALAKLHTRPQAPQLFTSEAVARQTPEQLVCPAGQVCPHTPPVQLAPPPVAGVQTFRQRPQLAVSVWMLVSQPLAGLPSQSAKPAAQV